MVAINKTDALIAVDVQNDFCPGGALGVNGGDEVVAVINRMLPKFKTRAFSRDWHPPDHISFSDKPTFTDKSWPAHCVRETRGAAFHQDLKVPKDAIIVNKATERDKEAYSALDQTGLGQIFKERGVKRVFIAGLATDYCVKATALDALKEGFAAVVIADAVRAVDVPPGTGAAALEEIKKSGARVMVSVDLV